MSFLPHGHLGDIPPDGNCLQPADSDLARQDWTSPSLLSPSLRSVPAPPACAPNLYIPPAVSRPHQTVHRISDHGGHPHSLATPLQGPEPVLGPQESRRGESWFLPRLRALPGSWAPNFPTCCSVDDSESPLGQDPILLPGPASPWNSPRHPHLILRVFCGPLSLPPKTEGQQTPKGILGLQLCPQIRPAAQLPP